MYRVRSRTSPSGAWQSVVDPWDGFSPINDLSVPPGTYDYQIAETDGVSDISYSEIFTLTVISNFLASGKSSVTSFVSAVIDDGQGDKLKVTFNGKVLNVDAKQFRLAQTFARIIDQDHPDYNAELHHVKESISGINHTYTFSLDEHLLPGETPKLWYWYEGGTAISDGDKKKISALEGVDITNNVATYSGTKNVVVVPSNGTYADVQAAAVSGNRVAITRGLVDTGSYDTWTIAASDVKFTAVGAGNNPSLRLQRAAPVGSSRPIQIEADHVVFACIDFTCDDVGGICVNGTSSYCGVVSCTFTGTSTNQFSKGVQLSNRTITADTTTAQRNGGNFVGFCNIDGMAEAVSCAQHDFTSVWEERYLRDNAKLEIYGNTLRATDHGVATGDCGTFNRGDFEFTRVHHNYFLSWYDDGLDVFQGARLIVEYNYFENESATANASGGTAIKAGAEGLTASERDAQAAFSSGFTSDLIVRYNHIKGVRAGGQKNGIRISGGDRSGMVMTIGSKTVTYGDSYVYGNVFEEIDGNALQVDKADGRYWKVFNNYFKADGKSANAFESYNLDQLVFENNILDGNVELDGNDATVVAGVNNIKVGGFYIAYTSTNDLPNSTLTNIFDNLVSVTASTIKGTSPTIQAGLNNLYQMRTGFHGEVVQQLDVGPIQSTVTAEETKLLQNVYLDMSEFTLGAQLVQGTEVGAFNDIKVDYTGGDQSQADGTDVGTSRYGEVTVNNLSEGTAKVWLKMKRNATVDSFYVGVQGIGYFTINATASSATDLEWAWCNLVQIGGLGLSYGDPAEFTLTGNTNVFQIVGREQIPVGGMFISLDGTVPTL